MKTTQLKDRKGRIIKRDGIGASYPVITFNDAVLTDGEMLAVLVAVSQKRQEMEQKKREMETTGKPVANMVLSDLQAVSAFCGDYGDKPVKINWQVFNEASGNAFPLLQSFAQGIFDFKCFKNLLTNRGLTKQANEVEKMKQNNVFQMRQRAQRAVRRLGTAK